MPVTPYFRMIKNLALRSWQSVWQSTSRHQMDVWYRLDSAADLSSTNSIQDYCLDVEHQPTDLGGKGGHWASVVRPSSCTVQPGLCATSQGWPSGSMKTPE